MHYYISAISAIFYKKKLSASDDKVYLIVLHLGDLYYKNVTIIF